MQWQLVSSDACDGSSRLQLSLATGGPPANVSKGGIARGPAIRGVHLRAPNNGVLPVYSNSKG